MPTLGRGKLYFDKFNPGVKTGNGFRYIGNTPEFNLGSESETLDHFNSDEGVRVKDDSVLLQLDRTGSFTTDKISPENMALFLLGSSSILAQGALTAQTYTIVEAKKDRYYQIGQTLANPAGFRDITITSVVDDATVPNTLTLNDDYTVDLVTGLIYFLPTGSVTEVDDVTITFNVAARSRSRIVTAAAATIEGALKFIAYNPKGDNIDFLMPYVQLSPNGEFALKGDEWQTLPFNVEILKLSDTVESIYADGRPYTP